MPASRIARLSELADAGETRRSPEDEPRTPANTTTARMAVANPVATNNAMRIEWLRLRCNSTPPMTNPANDWPASECARSRGRRHEGPS